MNACDLLVEAILDLLRTGSPSVKSALTSLAASKRAGIVLLDVFSPLNEEGQFRVGGELRVNGVAPIVLTTSSRSIKSATTKLFHLFLSEICLRSTKYNRYADGPNTLDRLEDTFLKSSGSKILLPSVSSPVIVEDDFRREIANVTQSTQSFSIREYDPRPVMVQSKSFTSPFPEPLHEESLLETASRYCPLPSDKRPLVLIDCGSGIKVPVGYELHFNVIGFADNARQVVGRGSPIQVIILETGHKNAAELAMAFTLGMFVLSKVLSTRLVYVVSYDNATPNIMALLQRCGVNARKMGTLPDPPSVRQDDDAERGEIRKLFVAK